MKSRLLSQSATIIFALLLSGCRIIVATQVNADGSGELRNQVVYSAEETENFAQAPGNEGKSICDNLNEDPPAGVTEFVEEQRGDETYCTSTQSFDNLSQLRSKYDLMQNVTVNQLEMTWGRFVFDVDVDTPAAGPNDHPVPTEWHLTVPGTVEENNAERVEGQTLIWTMTPGQTTAMHAESTGSFGYNTPVIIGAVILALLLALGIAGGLIALIARQRKRVS